MAKRKIPSGLRKSTTTEAMKAVFRYDLGDLKGTFISIREIFDNGLARCDLYRDRNYTELIIENIFVPLADIENLHR